LPDFHWEIAGFFTGTSPVFPRDFRETDENVIEMAVGVIIGGAFGKIVTSLVSDVVMPPIGLLIGGLNFSDLKWTMKQAVTDASGAVISPAVTLNWGNFIQVTVDFLIIAIVIFAAIKFINQLTKKKAEEKPAPAPAPEPDDVKLPEEIRDLLKEKK